MKRETEIKLLNCVKILPWLVLIGVILAVGGWWFILIMGSFVLYIKLVHYVERLPDSYKAENPVKYKFLFGSMIFPMLALVTLGLSWFAGYAGFLFLGGIIIGVVILLGLFAGEFSKKQHIGKTW